MPEQSGTRGEVLVRLPRDYPLSKVNMEPETKWLHGEVAEDVTTRAQHPTHKTMRGIVLVATIAVLADVAVIVATQSVESEFALAQLLGRIVGFGIAIFVLQRLLRWILRKIGFSKDSDWTALIIAALIYLAVFSFFTFSATAPVTSPALSIPTSSMSVPTSIPVPTPALKQNPDITNPDYVANPSAYLVDYTGKISSQMPTDKALWVEQILGPTSINVSYTVAQAGANIIKLKDLTIPGLGWPPDPLSSKITMQQVLASKNYPVINDSCWRQQVQSFLAQNVLHRWVYLSRTPISSPFGPSVGWQLLMTDESGSGKNDLAEMMVVNGYGLIPSDLQVTLYNPFEFDLYSDQSVASLAKRGAWGVCGR